MALRSQMQHSAITRNSVHGFDRIAHEVYEDLLQLASVARYERQPGRERGLHAHSVSLQIVAQYVEDVCGQLDQIERFVLLTGLAKQSAEIVEHLARAMAVADHAIQGRPRLIEIGRHKPRNRSAAPPLEAIPARGCLTSCEIEAAIASKFMSLLLRSRWSSATERPSSSVRWRSCVSNRVFSIAMMAWAAKLWTSSICRALKGRTASRISTITPIGVPSRSNGTPSTVRYPSRCCSAPSA